ncbi:MAG: hypothetical protein JRH15_13535 [Deltaproteobacteria bacterium]|nr:hypothetical protein [Deltaproteobacteria bacterium]
MPGETQTVTMDITPNKPAFWNMDKTKRRIYWPG